MQSYDLMSAVSEITKDTDQAINWPSVKFVGQENHSFTNDPQGHLHSRCVTGNQQWSVEAIYETMLQPHQSKAGNNSIQVT